MKIAQMFHESLFQEKLRAFSDGFRELENMMKEIREALFQLQPGRVIAGSEQEQDQLYDAFLGVIQRQLDKMSKQW